MIVKPYFYDSFICKADKCSDTCCAGWEIDIDDISMKKFNEITGKFADRLKNGITVNSENQNVFRLKENDRCYFLCNDGLCEIYSELGKNSLCDICREHPRFYNYYDNVVEMGLGLCCEKVCELIFLDDKHIDFVVEDYTESDDDYVLLSEIRNVCINIINNRDADFSVNINNLIDYVAEINNRLYFDSAVKQYVSDKKDLFFRVVDIFEKTDPINSEWTDLVFALKNNIDKICKISEEFRFDAIEYEQFISYVFYRHFIEAGYEYGLIQGLSFAVAGLIFVHMCDCVSVLNNGNYTKNDRIFNVKLWSKQIEYSAENTEKIMNSSVELLYL